MGGFLRPSAMLENSVVGNFIYSSITFGGNKEVEICAPQPNQDIPNMECLQFPSTAVSNSSDTIAFSDVSLEYNFEYLSKSVRGISTAGSFVSLFMCSRVENEQPPPMPIPNMAYCPNCWG